MNNTIIVGSLGRAGSTTLYQSIGQTIQYNLTNFQDNLKQCDYQKKCVYQTHDFPPNNLPKHTKFIWTFADPYEIVLSVLNQGKKKGVNWVEDHFDHLKGNFDKYDNIFNYDAMRLEKHFDEWYKNHSFELLTIKYRTIWKEQRKLSRFIGNYIDLPMFNDREDRFSKLDKGEKKKLEDTYGELHNKIENAENFKVW